MSGYAWSSKVGVAFDRTLDPPDDVDPPAECTSCGALECMDCGGCSEDERELCTHLACTCPKWRRKLALAMLDSAYERAIDDAVDDARMREDEDNK